MATLELQDDRIVTTPQGAFVPIIISHDGVYAVANVTAEDHSRSGWGVVHIPTGLYVPAAAKNPDGAAAARAEGLIDGSSKAFRTKNGALHFMRAVVAAGILPAEANDEGKLPREDVARFSTWLRGWIEN